MSSLEHVYEREVLSTAAYLCGSNEPHLKVVKHLQCISGRGRHSLLSMSNSVAIIDKYQLDGRGVEIQVVSLSPKPASNIHLGSSEPALEDYIGEKEDPWRFLLSVSDARVGYRHPIDG